jgi:signal transduction histidine kinase
MNAASSVSGLPLSGQLWRLYAVAWAVVAAGLILTVLVAWRVAEHARQLDQDRFQRLVRQSAVALQGGVEKYEVALHGLAEYLAVRPDVSVAEWRFRVRLLWPEQRYPGLLEIGFAEVSAETAPSFGGEAQASAPAPASPPVEPASLRLFYSWVRPPSASDGIGADFLADPVIVQSARNALRSGQTAPAYRRMLAAEVGGNRATGFTLIVPVFDPAVTAHRTSPRWLPEEDLRRVREKYERGVVFGNIVPGLLLENLFGVAPRELDFDLFSGPIPAADNWLNVRGRQPPTLRPEFDPYLQTNFVLQLSSDEWSAIFHTTPLFEKESLRHRSRVTAAAGLALTGLVGALMFTQIRARLRQEDIAAELRAACDDLQQVQNERERIGRDLHDGTIQSLYGLQLSLGHYERLLAREPEAARGLLARCRTDMNALIQELRTFIVQHLPGDENPDRVANSGAALQQLVHRFQSASSVPIELALKDSPPTPVTLGQQIHLRQIAQEAISNSLRHGRPRHIKVELQRYNQHLRLRVADDGAGFDTSRANSGQGLANMQARAIQLGGRLQVKSQPDHGTEVTLEMPIQG